MTKPGEGIALKESDWKLMSGRLKQSKDLCISSPKRTCWEHDKSRGGSRRLSPDALGSARRKLAHLHLGVSGRSDPKYKTTAALWASFSCNVQILLLCSFFHFSRRCSGIWRLSELCKVLIYNNLDVAPLSPFLTYKKKQLSEWMSKWSHCVNQQGRKWSCPRQHFECSSVRTSTTPDASN